MAQLGRILFDQDEPSAVYMQFGHGIALVPTPVQIEEGIASGDMVLWFADIGQIVSAPQAVTDNQLPIGVVRHVDEDGILVERDLSLIAVKPASEQVPIGSTVVLDPVGGRITRVVSHETISSRPDFGPKMEGADVQPVDAADLDWDSFGGFEEIKSRVKEIVELPLLRADDFRAIGARPIKGVLFTGPPGTGKTHLARIVAAQCNAAFFQVNGPEIFNMYYGQSEQRIRELFATAKTYDRSIIFFDEIDSIAGMRTGESHEVSQRVVAQLLTEMDGFTSTDSVVVIAATNRPHEIDPALMRPGRFDWKIEFALPNHADRIEILKSSCKDLATSGDLPLGELADRTNNWSSAELASIFTEAALLAVADCRREIFSEDLWGGWSRITRSRIETEAQ